MFARKPLTAITLLAAIAGTALAGPGSGHEITPASTAVLTSPGHLWDMALHESDLDQIVPALSTADWDAGSLPNGWVESIASLQENLAKRESQRSETIESTSTELDEHLAAYHDTGSPIELSEALANAVSLQLLMGHDESFFHDDRIVRLVDAATEQARTAEAKGNWVIASELFYRLDAIYDTDRRFKDDVDRLARRLGMIRLYAPERLWELRNERRIDEGLDPLPPYNPYGDLFTDKLKGIDSVSVRTAIQRAAAQHVGRKSRSDPNGVTMGQLIVGGIDAILTMATTTDLAQAFPDLGDEESRRLFIDSLKAMRDRYASKGDVSAYDLRRAVDATLGASRDTVKIMPEALLHEFGNGAMAQLDDYSAIIWPDEVARFQRSTNGEFVGVGIRIQHDELMNIVVVSPLEGTPAQRAGMRAGDVITKVDGISAIGLGLDQAVEVITGPAGTDVTVTVERKDEDTDEIEELAFDLRRARIDIPSIKGWSKTGPTDDDWDYFIDDNDRIGYLRLTGFTENSTEEFDRAINTMKLQGLEALILDLRYNPGGLLDQAVSLASRFVDNGLIVKTVDASGITQDQQYARRVVGTRTLADIPIVVLVNEGSASASEILSGSIQAGARKGKLNALVLGARTFGKGSVQNVFVLPGGRSAMKLTTQYYQIDAPRMIHRLPGSTEWGVQPDLLVEMLPEQNADALILRRDADIYLSDDLAAERPDPDSLITDGTDLQVHAALVLLQSQLEGQVATTMIEQPNP